VFDGLRAKGVEGADELVNGFAVLAAYLDDLTLGSDTIDWHLRDSRQVLQRTRDSWLRMKLSTCSFGQQTVELLGHRVSFGKVTPSDDHNQVFSRFQEPRNESELLRFIGLVGLFAEHVEHSADKLAPLDEVICGTGWNQKKPKRRKIHIPDREINDGVSDNEHRSRHYERY
jgi:hypothetical protein